MEDIRSVQSVADSLTTLGLLAMLVVSLVRGWLIPVGRLEDWQHYASQAEDRAKLAELALAANTTELSKLTNTFETTNRHIEQLTRGTDSGRSR